ncbi:MAG: type II secretion system GspH family protein [Proteobacteria bacterium]|nr:type II secretion system GspH family protein [Pseudomonadota bacterium]
MGFKGGNKRGVTLIELVVAVAVLAILASAVFPVARMAVKRTKEMELRYNLRIIRKAIDDYKRAYDEKRITQKLGGSGYPPDLKTLVEGVEDITSPVPGKKIFFLRRIPRDPFNTDYNKSPEETWGIRSYSSEPDNPKEGDDVFDVYSLSEEKAIDGTYYKDW